MFDRCTYIHTYIIEMWIYMHNFMSFKVKGRKQCTIAFDCWYFYYVVISNFQFQINSACDWNMEPVMLLGFQFEYLLISEWHGYYVSILKPGFFFPLLPFKFCRSWYLGLITWSWKWLKGSVALCPLMMTLWGMN